MRVPSTTELRWLRRSLCDRLETTSTRTSSLGWFRDRRQDAFLNHRAPLVEEGVQRPSRDLILSPLPAPTRRAVVRGAARPAGSRSRAPPPARAPRRPRTACAVAA